MKEEHPVSAQSPDSRTVSHVSPAGPRGEILAQGPHDDGSTNAPDLNLASAEQVARVDHMTLALARKVIERRDLRGGFHRWAELGEIGELKAFMIAELQRAFRLSPPG
jgi:DNA uptake protein ComE-like DNA-binding protein